MRPLGATAISHFVLSGMTLALFGLSRVVFNAVGFRYFGSAEVGAVNVAMSTAVLLSLPTTAGLCPAYTRYVALTSDEGRPPLFAWTMALFLPILTLLALVSVLVPGPLAHVTALWVCLYSFYSLGRADQFAANRPGGAVALEVSSFLLFLLVLFLSIPFDLPLAVAISAYFLPVALYCLRLALRARGVKRAERGFWTFTLLALLGSVPSLGVLYGSTIAMHWVGGLEAAGVWAALVSLVSPVLLVPRTLSSVFLPKLAATSTSSASSDADAWSALTGSHRRLAAALSPVLVCLALGLAGPLVHVTVGRAATKVELLWWLMVVLSMYMAVRLEPLITCLAALGKNGISTIGAFVGGAVCLLIWAAGAWLDNPTLVPVGYLASAVSRLLALQLLILRGKDRTIAWREAATPGDVIVAIAVVAYSLGQPLLVATAGTALAAFLCWREVMTLRDVFHAHEHAFRARG